MMLTLRPADLPAEIDDWHNNGNTEPSNADVRKNAGALISTGILRHDRFDISGGRYTEIAPAISIATPAKVTGFQPRFRISVSLKKDPAAIPARYVESSSANAGARSKVASAKIRNHAISNPSARKPASPAMRAAVSSRSTFAVPASSAASSGGAASACLLSLRP